MTTLYSLISAFGAITGVGIWLYRRYKLSVASELQPFRSFVVGSIRLRILSFFSAQAATALSARQYALAALRATSDQIEIPSLRPVRVELDKAYIRLTMTSAAQERISDEDLLAGSDSYASYLVLGDPGSGKSTLMRKLYRELCVALFERPRASVLPIFLELRRLPWEKIAADSPGAWLESIVSEKVQQVRSVHDGEFVYRAYLGGRGVTVLLDGLDEVPSKMLGVACRAISELSKSLATSSSTSSTILVTGRIQLRSALDRSFSSDFSQTCVIEPFSSADVYSFLERWPYKRSRSHEVARIFKNIQGSASLHEMCRNPLVLSMYVARDQQFSIGAGGRTNRLPDQRTAFYSEIVNELLFFRRQAQEEAEIVDGRLRRQREEALSRIALEHLLDADQPPNSISWLNGVDIVQDIFGHERDAAERELRKIAIDTGLISEERFRETFQFMHLTICEFFAARETTEKHVREVETLVESYLTDRAVGGSRRLTELIVFYCGITGRAARRDVVSKLIQRAMTWDDYVIPLRVLLESNDSDRHTLGPILERFTHEAANLPAESRTATMLLFECLASAGEVRSGPSHRSALPTPHEFVAHVCNASDRPSQSFAGMFHSFMSVDPSAAWQECRTRGQLDLVTAKSLSRAMEEPAVVNFAISMLGENLTIDKVWIQALLEAGLTHRLVAKLLQHGPVPSAVAERKPNGADWFSVGPAAGTLYGSLLCAATRAYWPDGVGADLPMSGGRKKETWRALAENGTVRLAYFVRYSQEL